MVYCRTPAKGTAALDDAVDEVIERGMDSGGEVFFYPTGILEIHQKIGFGASRCSCGPAVGCAGIVAGDMLTEEQAEALELFAFLCGVDVAMRGGLELLPQLD